MLKFILVVAFLVIFSAHENKAMASENLLRTVFLYNSQKYPSEILDNVEKSGNKNIPEELQKKVQPGDFIGFQLYEDNKLIREMSGIIQRDEETIFSNGIRITTRDRTVLQIFRILEAVDTMLQSPNYPYYPPHNSIHLSIEREIPNIRIEDSEVLM